MSTQMLFYPPPPGHLVEPPPSAAPVVGFTLAFGPFGAISAARRADRARLRGGSVARYWVAYGVTLGLMVLAVAGAGLTLLGLHLKHSSDPNATTVEASLTSDDRWVTGSGLPTRVTDAACIAYRVDGHGAGLYRCLLTFRDVDAGAANPQLFRIAVSRNGNWDPA